MEKIKEISSWLTVITFIMLYILVIWHFVNAFPYVTVYVFVLFITSLIAYGISYAGQRKTK